MENGKVQAWLAGYACGGATEAARAVADFNAFFGEPSVQVGPAYATGAQHGLVFVEDGAASVVGLGCGGSIGGASVETKPDAPAPQVYTVAFGDSVTLETACAKLSALAVLYGVTYEGKFSGKTLRANPGDTIATVEHRYWTSK